MLLYFHIVAGGKHLVTESYTEFLTKKQTLYRKGVQKFGSNIDIEKIQLKTCFVWFYPVSQGVPAIIWQGLFSIDATLISKCVCRSFMNFITATLCL